MSKKFLIFFTVILAALALVAMNVVSEEAEKKEEESKPAHDYVGAKKCKFCHKVEYNSWLETGHAGAYDLLTDEEKKKPECVTCHITGTTKKDELVEGVQCEACHGPGGDYKSPKIMSRKKWAADPETYKAMAIEAGLVYPTEEDCTRCHKKEGNPNFKPFDFEKRKGEVHAMSSEEE